MGGCGQQLLVLSVRVGVKARATYFCWMNSDLSALRESKKVC